MYESSPFDATIFPLAFLFVYISRSPLSKYIHFETYLVSLHTLNFESCRTDQQNDDSDDYDDSNHNRNSSIATAFSKNLRETASLKK
jgi:hypothetical protein